MASKILRIYIPDAHALTVWASGRRANTGRFARQSYCRSMKDAREACDRLREQHQHRNQYAVHVERADGSVTTELI